MRSDAEIGYGIYDDFRIPSFENKCYNTDQKGPGAPIGNKNAEGPHKKTIREKAESRLIGTKTEAGQTIKRISNHAIDRLKGRGISIGRLEKTLKSKDFDNPGKEKNTVDYFTKGCKVSVSNNGTVKTIMWGKKYNDRGN